MARWRARIVRRRARAGARGRPRAFGCVVRGLRFERLVVAELGAEVPAQRAVDPRRFAAMVLMLTLGGSCRRERSTTTA